MRGRGPRGRDLGPVNGLHGRYLRWVDDALPSRLFERLHAAIERLGETGLSRTYQTSFWFGRGAAPSCVVEEAIEAVAGRLPPKVDGYEWWLSRMRTSNVQVDFHRDRDERLALAGGVVRHPRTSSVLFLNRCTGGLLAVTRAPPDERNPAKAPTRLDFDLVEPRPNRLVWFEGRMTHGVLDARNQIPGARLPRQQQLRLSIPINAWDRKPHAVPDFAHSRAYRSLRDETHRRRL